MKEYGKWVWRMSQYGMDRVGRTVRWVDLFGFVRERWEWFHTPKRGPVLRFASYVEGDQWLALLNGDPLPDRYQEGWEAGKKAERIAYPLDTYHIDTATGKSGLVYSTEALEAELKRRRTTTTLAINSGNYFYSLYYRPVEVLERRKADRRQDKPDHTCTYKGDKRCPGCHPPKPPKRKR